ncbi:hypothetical protein D3C76_862160 [compost metagenome]
MDADTLLLRVAVHDGDVRRVHLLEEEVTDHRLVRHVLAEVQHDRFTALAREQVALGRIEGLGEGHGAYRSFVIGDDDLLDQGRSRSFVGRNERRDRQPVHCLRLSKVDLHDAPQVAAHSCPFDPLLVLEVHPLRRLPRAVRKLKHLVFKPRIAVAVEDVCHIDVQFLLPVKLQRAARRANDVRVAREAVTFRDRDRGIFVECLAVCLGKRQEPLVCRQVRRCQRRTAGLELIVIDEIVAEDDSVVGLLDIAVDVLDHAVDLCEPGQKALPLQFDLLIVVGKVGSHQRDLLIERQEVIEHLLDHRIMIGGVRRPPRLDRLERVLTDGVIELLKLLIDTVLEFGRRLDLPGLIGPGQVPQDRLHLLLNHRDPGFDLQRIRHTEPPTLMTGRRPCTHAGKASTRRPHADCVA